MGKFKLGTIGSGTIVHAILDAVEQTQGIQCIAVYSRTLEKGKSLANKYKMNKIYTDMDTFLADKEINCVYITSPNLLHYEQARKTVGIYFPGDL